MGAHQPSAMLRERRPWVGAYLRPLDSFGIVLLLIILDYVVVSAAPSSGWGKVSVVVLLGATLLFALRTSQARRIWQLLAATYLLVSTLFTLISVVVPGARDFSQQTSILAGVLLIVTPIAILRRISMHTIVTNETVLGAVCVYLLIGFSFAFIYLAISYFGPTPFFVGQAHATSNQCLFFSYTTLTTVGYGNLVPAGNVGQTFAMLEALSGQIYLVIIVARLVSLWGQQTPRAAAKSNASAAAGDEPHDLEQSTAATPARDVPTRTDQR